MVERFPGLRRNVALFLGLRGVERGKGPYGTDGGAAFPKKVELPSPEKLINQVFIDLKRLLLVQREEARLRETQDRKFGRPRILSMDRYTGLEGEVVSVLTWLGRVKQARAVIEEFQLGPWVEIVIPRTLLLEMKRVEEAEQAFETIRFRNEENKSQAERFFAIDLGHVDMPAARRFREKHGLDDTMDKNLEILRLRWPEVFNILMEGGGQTKEQKEHNILRGQAETLIREGNITGAENALRKVFQDEAVNFRVWVVPKLIGIGKRECRKGAGFNLQK